METTRGSQNSMNTSPRESSASGLAHRRRGPPVGPLDAPFRKSELKIITKSPCNSCVIVPRKPQNFTEFLSYYLKSCNIYI